MNVIRISVISLLLVTFISILCIWLMPTLQDFMQTNATWNGMKTLASEREIANINNLDELREISPGSTLVLIPYLECDASYLLTIKQILENGNTVILADDFGYGNDILEELGVDLRFTEELLSDPLFCYRNYFFPKIMDFNRSFVPTSVQTIVLNHASSINIGEAAESNVHIIAASSNTSFRDVNGNGIYDGDDQKGPFPVCVQTNIGKGKLILMSDPSILLNSMLGIAQNNEFVNTVLIKKGTGSQVYLDNSHLGKSTIDVSKTNWSDFKAKMTSPYLLLGLIGIVFIGAFSLLGKKNGGSIERKL